MQRKTSKDLLAENQELQARVEELQETLDAIQRGEVDGLIVSTPKGEQVYTMSGAEKPYRILMENMREGAITLSDDNIILYCNLGFAKMLKVPLEKIVGNNIENMISPTFKITFEELLAKCRKSPRQEAETKGITFIANDKTLLPTQISVNSLKMDHSSTTFIIVTDLTQHMEEDLKHYTADLEKAGTALFESEQRWSTTLGSIGDAVIATDMVGKIIYMNAVAEELTGWSLRKAIGGPVKAVFKIISEATRKTVDDPVAKVLKKGYVVGLANHTLLIRQDGTEVAIDDSGAPIKDKVGKTTGVVLIFRDITERRKAEEALRESRAKLQVAFASLTEAIFMADAEGNIVDFNDEFVRYHRFRDKNECSRNIADCPRYLDVWFLDGTPAPVERWAMARALRGEVGSNVEYRLRRKETGETWWGSYNFSPIKDPCGKIVGAVVAARDMTGFKEAEAQTLFQKAILEGINTIFQAALTVPSEQDLGQICLEVAEKVTGSKFGFIGYINPKGLEDVAISNPGWEGCKTIDADGHRRPPGNFALHGIYGRVLKDGKALFTNNPSAHPDSIALPKGHPPLEAFLGVPLKREGKTIGMIAVSNREGGYSQSELEGLEALAPAIVEAFLRKRAENALNRLNEELEERVQKRTQEVSIERQRLYNVLETLPAYVVLLDKDYRMPFANKVFRETFGESHGRRCHEYLFGRDSECENCETYKVLKTIKPQHWEWTGPNKHDYEIYDYPFVEADGSTLILEMGIDVTERKKAEREAQEAAKKLKDSERLAAIGATAGMVGHDIRNPLQAITGDVYLAKTELDSLPDSDEKKNTLDSLQEIEKNIDYINKIVQDLQDYARPLNPMAGETDLKLIIAQLLEKNSWPDNIELSVKVENNAKKISADPYYINRILYNLVTNAVQAMPKGGKLTIHAFESPKDLVLTVKDTGIGIPKDVQGKMFTLMFTTKAKGQGFGLPVVKRMTEALGGTVSFESEEGKGTTFTVRLPLNR